MPMETVNPQFINININTNTMPEIPLILYYTHSTLVIHLLLTIPHRSHQFASILDVFCICTWICICIYTLYFAFAFAFLLSRSLSTS